MKHEAFGRLVEDEYHPSSRAIEAYKERWQGFGRRHQKGSEPAFIDDVFYVRTNPATDQLQGERLYKYLAERFKSGFA